MPKRTSALPIGRRAGGGDDGGGGLPSGSTAGVPHPASSPASGALTPLGLETAPSTGAAANGGPKIDLAPTGPYDEAKGSDT